MKKLLVLALSAVLVFAMASMSMAAVAITGEANFGLTISPSNPAPQSSDCKIVFDAAVNDVVSVNAAIKAGNSTAVTMMVDDDMDPLTPDVAVSIPAAYFVAFDTYSASVKMATGTLKIGYFGTNFNGKTDILAKKNRRLKGSR